MNQAWKISAAAAALLLALAPTTSHALPTFGAIYAFGDSLSDAGNVYLATGGTDPGAPYFNGQFSNGPTWIQDLSVRLGLGPLAPSLAGGTDYAFGGATTGNASTEFAAVPDLNQQVGLFASTLAGGAAPSSALYSVWIGGNDLFSILNGGVAGACAADPIGCAQAAAQSEATAISTLVGMGASHFLVPLQADLGSTPGLLAQGPIVAGAATALTEAYNAALVADLAGLAAAPGIDLTLLDTLSLEGGLIANPAAWGLTDVTDSCYVGPETGGGTVCANPDQYLYWDQVHPTAAVHALIAQAAERALPEPGTLPAVLAALAAFWVALRARRSGGARHTDTDDGRISRPQ